MAKGKNQELTPEEWLTAALVPEGEQPYEVPGNWVWTRLGNVAQIIMGQSPSGNETTDDSSYIGLIGGAADMGELYPKISRYTMRPTKLSRINDIIISIRATLGKPIYSDGKYCLGRGVAALRSDIIENSFIRYFINAFEEKLVEVATGTTFAQVSKNDIENMLFPLPSLAEQQRIVERIESLFEKLDRAKELAQNALDSFEIRKVAILHKTFTGELTAKWREENNLGLETWERKFAKEICGFITKGETPTKYVSSSGEIPFLKVYNIRDNKLDFAYNSAFIPNEIHQQKLKRSVVYPNDVIMNIVGPPLQKVAIVTDEYPEWNINQAIAIFRPKKDILSNYLYYVLVCEDTLISVLNDVRGVVGQSNISLEQCRNLVIPLPTIAEQQEIVRILDSLLEKEQRAKELCDTIVKIDLMKKSILARAFRGELGTNNPMEESSFELLKEILSS